MSTKRGGKDTPQSTAVVVAPPPLTVDVALGNAARLLAFAEGETNLAAMERMEKLADSWTAIASLLVHRETN